MAIQRKRGRAGQAQRLRRLKRTGFLCEICLAAKRTATAIVVDHIKPLAYGGSDDDSNTRNLCGPCHRQVTVDQFGFDVARGKRGVGIDGRPRDRDHPWSATAPATPAVPRRTPRGVQSDGRPRPDTA